MRKTLALMTCVALLGFGAAPSASAQTRNDNVRAGVNAAAQARAARNIRSDLNRSQIDMSRMQRLQTNQAVRNRAASGIAGSITVDSCSYQYRRWRQTRSGYWRDRYYDCID